MVKRGWKKASLVSLVLLVLALALMWPQIKPTVMLTAVMPGHAEETDALLTPLAEEIVGEADAYGSFFKLDQFIEQVRTLYPELSDEALAGFIARYTGQPELAVEESCALFLLEYDNVTVNKFENGEDGYTLTTGYSNTGDNGYNQEYALWSMVSWKHKPARGNEEVLRTGTNDCVYNNHVREYGFVLQQFDCKKCGEATNICRNISNVYEKDWAKRLEFNFEKATAPGIKFSFLKNTCQNCGSRRGEERAAVAFSSYGVILNGMTSTGTAYTEYSVMGRNSTGGLTIQPAAE